MDTLKFLLSSLFSNQKITDEVNKRPWWLALVMLVLSLCVSVVPTLTSGLNVNGSDIISASENYNIDQGLKQLSYDFVNNAELTSINADVTNGKFRLYDKDDDTDFTNVYTVKEADEENAKILMTMVYTPSESTDAVYDAILASATVEQKVEEEPTVGKSTYYVHNMLVFTPDYVYLYLFNGKTTGVEVEKKDADTSKQFAERVLGKAASYTSGETKYIEHFSIDTFYTEAEGSSTTAQLNKAYSKWKTLFDEAAHQSIVTQTWVKVGMFSGINLLMVLVMSLAFFLLSRTKSSIRKFKFLEAFKSVSFGAFTPAVLALVLGYMISSLQTMGFILFIGLRAMWMGMKATTPQDGGSNEPIRK